MGRRCDVSASRRSLFIAGVVSAPMRKPSLPPARPPNPDPRDQLFAADRAAARDIAAYVAEVSAELQALADGAGLALLAQFLAMARLEAEMQARLGRRED